MPNALPAVGTASYNGFTFSSLTRTEGVKVTAVWDKAGRTITHLRHVITIKTRVASTPPATITATMAALKDTLMAPAKPFRYLDKGFDLVVNVGAVKDVAFGPKPMSFDFAHVGNNYAADVTWVVEVYLPACENGSYTGIMSANFQLFYDIDEIGFTTRTYSGSITIATTRDGRRLVDNADAYREKFVPAVPKYFRRMSQSYTLSEDKAKLDVRIVDKELPADNFPPPGCVNVDFEHKISCNFKADGDSDNFFTTHTASMSATYTMARGASAEHVAIRHFQDIVEDRVYRYADLAAKKQAGAIKNVLPIGSSITEVNAFDVNKLKVSLSYVITCEATVFMRAGLWTPIRGSRDYDLWAKSMDKTFSPRGNAGMKFQNNDEVIIDLCLGTERRGKLNNEPARPKRPEFGRIGNNAIKKWPYPSEDGSFIGYATAITVTPTDRVMRHVPLESGEARLRTPALLNDRDSFARLAAIPKGSDPPILQARAASTPTLIFEGYAIRAGYRIPCPTLRSAYGYSLVPANEQGFGYEEIDLPFSGPIPFFLSRWRLRFMMSDRPFDPNVGGAPQPQAGQPQPVFGNGFGNGNNPQAPFNGGFNLPVAQAPVNPFFVPVIFGQDNGGRVLE